MRRSVIGTIEQMLSVIENNDLRQDLQAVKDGIFLELPEDNGHLWAQAARVLEKHIVASDDQLTDWEKNVFLIWQGKSC